MGEVRNLYKILVRKPEEKRPLRWEKNNRLDLTEICWDSTDSG